MKRSKVSAVLPLIASLVLCGHSPALTPVKDNFNEPELDTKRWKLVQSGNAKLVQSDGSLHFTVGRKASKEPNFAYVELRHNQPGFNETWMVRLGARNFVNNGPRTGIGFWIHNADDPTDAMFFQLNQGPEAYTARAGFLLNNQRIETELKRQAGDSWLSLDLIITFNPQAKLFTFYFGGEDWHYGSDVEWRWLKVGTFSPTGHGGDARANWQMNRGSGRFGIRLAGFGADRVINRGWAYIPYFGLKQTIEFPDD